MKEVSIRIWPKHINDQDHIKMVAANAAQCKFAAITDLKIIKKSIDARKSSPVFVLQVQLYFVDDKIGKAEKKDEYKEVGGKQKIIIIGAGPAGYFAALQCLRLGMYPIILERGKDAQQRRRDLRAIQQLGIVNPDSNYCFGEGGAGTYSDGKLYTRSKKRGEVRDILEILVDHGASSEILIDAHPHIGSNKLPKIIENIRQTILKYGGEIHFNQRVVDFQISNSKMEGVMTEDGKHWVGEVVLLATGHSARDIFELCTRLGVDMSFKPFAMGVRIEHPQALVDSIQYGTEERHENLPAASYSLVCQVGDKGVFSFCMCPGGLVVPAATAPGEIVVNGMSLSRRDSPFANAGTVMSIAESDVQHISGPKHMAGLTYQAQLEKKLFEAGDGSQKAPAQRLIDFTHGKLSSTLGDSSYIPGLSSQPLHDLLPPLIYKHLRQGVKEFSKKMKGYWTNEAMVIGVESRTSSPVKIERDKVTLMSTNVSGLFPCGEGAGYAGGILSAAMDGQNVARAIFKYLQS